ncbi:MAG: VapC toxin family PIN domain ribonuclease [Acidimicrobiales bacterium]|nr:MAG: VapC toxin family PIN domain ribonuclease [Acidimicrobiales bacterium]
MASWAADHEGQVVSSDLLRTELLRATRREAPEQMQRARAVLDALMMTSLPVPTFERAGTLEPDQMRNLDALHLAAALELGDELDGIITYDDRLTEAAALHGVEVVAPR